MVKDEEKNLDRCLKSLQSLRDEIDCEIIIVDTGSKDSTVNIAKEYTDKIYFHKWNKDFSDMRNKTISYAKGEWIMIIDADEQVEDTRLLIAFFNSNESNDFNTVILFVKNIAFTGTDYKSGIIKSRRLFRNDGEFRYEGVVHNQAIFREPSVQLDTTLIHYGYILDNKDLMENKFERTKDILVSELKKEPKNIYYQYQLGISYGMHNDYKQALIEMEKAYKLIQNEDFNFRKYIYVLNHLISYYIANNKIHEAEKMAEKVIDIDENNLDAYFNLGKVQLSIGKFEQGENSYKNYLRVLSKIKNEATGMDINNSYYTLTRVSEVYIDLAKLYYNRKEINLVLENILKIDTVEIIKENFDFIIKVFMEDEKYESIIDFFKNKFFTDEKLKDIFIIKIEDIIKDVDVDRRINIYKKLIDIKDEEYSLLLNARIDYYEKQDNNQYLNKSFELINLNEKYEFYGDLIYFGFKYNFDMKGVLANITEKNIDAYFNYIHSLYDDFSTMIMQYIKVGSFTSSFSDIRFNKILLRYIISWNNKVDDENYITIFNTYVDYGISFMNALYSEDVLQNGYICDLKNTEEIFFLFMLKAKEYINKDKAKYIVYLRKALQEAPYASRGIDLMLKDIQQELESQNNEFEEYKIQVKNTIKQLIEAGEVDNAESIIADYEKIVKDDVEIVLFKSEIMLKQMHGKSQVTIKKYNI